MQLTVDQQSADKRLTVSQQSKGINLYILSQFLQSVETFQNQSFDNFLLEIIPRCDVIFS